MSDFRAKKHQKQHVFVLKTMQNDVF